MEIPTTKATRGPGTDDAPSPSDHRPDARLAIRATLLRSFLLLELDRAGRDRTVTVAELVQALHRAGFTVPGRPGKVVSDALRTEVGRGRARWVSRGRYRIGTLPRTTRWRCHKRVAAARAGQARPCHLARPRRRPDAGHPSPIRIGHDRSPHRPVVAERRNAPPPTSPPSLPDAAWPGARPRPGPEQPP
jgi:hypothetical protein